MPSARSWTESAGRRSDRCCPATGRRGVGAPSPPAGWRRTRGSWPSATAAARRCVRPWNGSSSPIRSRGRTRPCARSWSGWATPRSCAPPPPRPLSPWSGTRGRPRAPWSMWPPSSPAARLAPIPPWRRWGSGWMPPASSCRTWPQSSPAMPTASTAHRDAGAESVGRGSGRGRQQHAVAAEGGYGTPVDLDRDGDHLLAVRLLQGGLVQGPVLGDDRVVLGQHRDVQGGAVLDLVVALQQPGDGRGQALDLALGEEADVSEVDAVHGHIGLTDGFEGAQDGPVPAQHDAQLHQIGGGDRVEDVDIAAGQGLAQPRRDITVGQGPDLVDLLVDDDAAHLVRRELGQDGLQGVQSSAPARVHVQQEPSHPGHPFPVWSPRGCRPCGTAPRTADSIMSQAGTSSAQVTPVRRRCRKYSRLPSWPVRPLAPTARVTRPSPAAARATSRTARMCCSGSVTTPVRGSAARPTSNWGLTITSSSPSSRTTPPSAAITVRREMKERSATSRSAGPPSSSGVSTRTLIPSCTVTRGSSRTWAASWSCPMSTALMWAAPRRSSTSLNPPVDAPASTQRRPLGSMPSVSKALISLWAAREANSTPSGMSTTVKLEPAGTGAEGRVTLRSSTRARPSSMMRRAWVRDRASPAAARATSSRCALTRSGQPASPPRRPRSAGRPRPPRRCGPRAGPAPPAAPAGPAPAR